MSPLIWQKSSYSGEAANCLHVAASPDGAIRIRESDDPGVILATTRAGLAALLGSVKGGGRGRRRQGAEER